MKLSRVSKKFQKEKAKYLKAIYPIPSKLIKRGSDEGKSILLKISVKRKKRKNNAKSLFLRLFPVFLAQRRGFEPPVGFRPTHDFQSLRNSRKGAFFSLWKVTLKGVTNDRAKTQAKAQENRQSEEKKGVWG